MKPRSFLDLFRTRSGKLLLFACVFGAALLLYQQTRGKAAKDQESPTATPLDPESKTNRPQVVETVLRAMEAFRPPPPKPDPKPMPGVTNKPIEQAGVVQREASLPLSLFPDTVSQQLEPKRLSADYAPYGRLISCETVITVDSASIRTPIIGLVTEDIYHAGRLIIPAGTEVHGTAASDRVRERLSSGTAWTLVWQTGEELQLNAIALDREFESSTNLVGWGITDGSAGLRGRLIKSDNLAEIKLFAATFLTGAAEALTEKQPTIFGPIESPSLNNAPFEGAEKVLSVYAQRIYDSIQRDGFYVRIPSGKQFYLYVLQTIDRADARIGGTVPELAEHTEEANVMMTVPQVSHQLPGPISRHSNIPVHP